MRIRIIGIVVFLLGTVVITMSYTIAELERGTDE
ncbi:hypothetical protein IGJ15_000865 [Enterococcus sp. AZ079]